MKTATKQQVTIRLDAEVVEYFRGMSDDSGVAYQSLINLYLRDCVASGRRLRLSWEPAPRTRSRKS